MVKDKLDFETVEVTIESELKIQNNETKEQYTLTQAICEILNEIKKIKKAVV